MRLKTIYEAADKLAPFALSGEYCAKFDAYDNSGILIDCGREIEGVLFTLDLSKEAIARTKETGANCIFTHHPAIYAPLKRLGEDDCTLACIREGISVISAHLNLDCAQGGIDDCLMHGLGGTAAKKRMHCLAQGGYGTLFEVPETAMTDYAERVKATFAARRVLVYGQAPVRCVASFCGAGMDEESVTFALENGADTVVSSDAKHHLIARLMEHGCNLILLTHYAAENYGFYRFYEKMKNTLNVGCECFTDERYL